MGCERQQLIMLFPFNLPSWYRDIFHYVHLSRLQQGKFGERLAVGDFCFKKWVVIEKALEILI